MIHFVTGGIGAGKTAKMLELAASQPGGRADGVASIKRFEDGFFRGYDLRGVKSGIRIELAAESPDEEHYSDGFVFDRFAFNNEAFKAGTEIIKRAMDDDSVDAIFLDEVGPVELSGEGFQEALILMLSSASTCGKEIYISVRQGCLSELMLKFGIVCADCLML